MFPWFRDTDDRDTLRAYYDLLALMCRMTKESKRVLGKERDVENAKFETRVFLVRLGMVGDA
jgi:hypothetical protein